MADEQIPPEPVGDNLEPPEETPEVIETPEPVEPQYVTAEQVAEAVSKETQEMKTWMGRRDKELFGQIGGLIDERIPKHQQDPEEINQELLSDPVTTIRKIVNEATTEDNRRSQQHTTDAFTHIGTMMDSDPLYKDKELGNALIAEIKTQFQSGNLNTSLAPADAANVLQANALANVMRKRQGKNALAGNTPTKQVGNITPGIPGTKPLPKIPDLSPELKALARKWDYSDEDLARVYGKG